MPSSRSSLEIVLSLSARPCGEGNISPDRSSKARLLQDLQRAGGERHPVIALRLHPARRPGGVALELALEARRFENTSRRSAPPKHAAAIRVTSRF